MTAVATAQLDAIVGREHGEPHSILGAHPDGDGVVIRAFRPAARAVTATFDDGPDVNLEEIHPGGVFEGTVAGAELPLEYRLEVDYGEGGSFTIEDPYRCTPTIGDLDLHLIGEGRHEELYERLGAHVMEHEGAHGTAFAVWAPAARAVSVVGDFNSWDGRLHAMRSMGPGGVWEIFLPDVSAGARYKFELLTQDGELRLKADPYAQEAEVPPQTASVVTESQHRWGDADWLARRAESEPLGEPMSVYEVHLGSWRRNPAEGERPLSYLELADELSAYATDMGFTHVQLMPVMAHPFSGSWGYQVTGYFAPAARWGKPDELREFVDRMHQNGIGVILDWVPAHFPRDDFALARFDGTALYEHADPRRGAHPDWGTLIFNYGRHEVRNFLLSSALFWLREYHADGIRVDAVASMLYLDYSREEGEWVPNEFGGNEDLDAVSFLKEMNEVLYGREPGIVSVAEESTAWPGVSRPVYLGGLGFGFKWNMGWMHDSLGYFRQDPIYRRYHHHELTFSLMYAFSENFVLPLSHDEVVHGKGSLYDKMAGDRWQKFANLRALYAYMWAHPGKKLLFMGGEIAQEREWSHERSLDWHLLEQGEHSGIQALVRDLNRAYRDEPALWELDSDPAGFWWLEANGASDNVMAFARRSADGERVLVFVANLSPVPRGPFRLGLPRSSRWREVLNTDSSFYGGSDVGNLGGVQPEPIPWHEQPFSAELTLPPLAAIWLVPDERWPARGQTPRGSGGVSPRCIHPWELPLGARPRADGTTEFRVWAPRAESPALRVGDRDVELEDAGYGVFAAITEAAGGDDYAFVVDGAEVPDPCTRWQPGGLRGRSRVMDPAGFEWSDGGFRPAPLSDQVLYELHVGTFSREGTFEGVIPHLRALAEVGITAIELMPVAEFPGARGWGYDGVYLSAAHSAYGGPAGLARLVDAAHAEGLSVVLDVVYNHLGASGVKAMEAFGHYFTQKYETPWGRAINFDDEHSDPVREWVLQSAEGWVRDFHVDGLRLDAIHAIVDSNPEHLVAAVAQRVHAVRPGVLVIAESGMNDPRVMRPRDRGGHACDAAWADDFHHALWVLLTNDREGYYAEFGDVAQLARAFHRPHVHDGQYSTYRKRRFGAPADDVPAERFVVFDQNHDQVGNRAYGDRLPRETQPLAAFCTLLAPFTPMLFMGEEYGERAPFRFFSDHIDEKIATATREGRRREFAAFAEFGEEIPDPQSPGTFEASKLTRKRDPELARLYERLIAARRRMPGGDVAATEWDEGARWLRVLREPFELVCNFSGDNAVVPCRGGEVVVATHGDPRPGEEGIELEPLSGALIAP